MAHVILDKQNPHFDLQGRRTSYAFNKLCCSWSDIPQPFKSVGSDCLVGMLFQATTKKADPRMCPACDKQDTFLNQLV